MRHINSGNNFFSEEALAKYFKMKNPHNRFSAWTRDFHKQKLERRAQEAEHYPAPQVGFGNQYSHTFSGDEESDTGSNLDYNA